MPGKSSSFMTPRITEKELVGLFSMEVGMKIVLDSVIFYIALDKLLDLNGISKAEHNTYFM